MMPLWWPTAGCPLTFIDVVIIFDVVAIDMYNTQITSRHTYTQTCRHNVTTGENESRQKLRVANGRLCTFIPLSVGRSPHHIQTNKNGVHKIKF